MKLIQELKSKEKWEVKKLKEVGEFINGKAFKPSDWKKEGVPIVRIQNLNDSQKEYNYFQGECEEKYFLDNEDLLVSWSASLGVYRWNKGKALLNQHIFKVKPFEEIIDKNYLYYVLMTKINEMKTRVHGSTMKHITKGQFEKVEIPVPPISIQKKIVSILDKAERLKDERKIANEKSKKIIQSLFYEMFGDPILNDKNWEVSTLGQSCESFQNGIGKNKEFYGKGTKVANIGDLYESARFEPRKYSLLDVNSKEIELYKLKKGDLLFVRSSVKKEGVAYCSMYDSNEICLFSSFMIKTHPKKNLNPLWLSYFLREDKIRKILVDVSNTGTITNISQPILKQIRILIPPLELQNEFINKVNKIEKIFTLQKDSTEEINNLFESLMQEVFEE